MFESALRSIAIDGMAGATSVAANGASPAPSESIQIGGDHWWLVFSKLISLKDEGYGTLDLFSKFFHSALEFKSVYQERVVFITAGYHVGF